MKKLAWSLVIVLALGALAAGGWIARELYRPYRGYSGRLILEIGPHTSARDVAELLVAHGVLKYRVPFLARYLLGRARHKLKAGEYSFDRPLRPLDVYHKLTLGDIYLHPVTIPEGSDRFEMARLYEEKLGIPPQSFLDATRVTALIRDLDPQAPTLEGYLFPDTYRFPRGVSAARVVEAMVERFRHVLDTQFADEMAQPGVNLHDVVTLASLVEKETPAPEERLLVAGVFTRRLELKMPLACDPTVIYAARLDGRMRELPLPPIHESDLKFQSPYNTYLHAGLPPGPIASPGAASLTAAFHPADAGYLYFVSNTHGGHLFARTLAEHLRNVARYRQQVAAMRRESSVSTTAPEPSAPESNRGGNGGQKNKPRAKRQKPKTAISGVQPGTGTPREAQ